MYHVIAPFGEIPGALPDLVVPPATFDAQMRVLHDAGWHTITLAKLADDLSHGKRPARRSFVITVDDGYANGYTHAVPILRKYGFVASFYVIAGRVGQSAHSLTWPQVRAMLADGMEIGNHTVSHVDLARASDQDLAWQLRRAQEIVLAQTGYRMTTIAYPFGLWNMRAAAAVQKAGLLMAVTTQPGALETWGGRYWCPRVRVSPGTGATWLASTMAWLAGG